MPLFDFKCANAACPDKDKPVERLVKNSEAVPDCESCEQPMEKLPLEYRQFGWHSNMSSLRFHFNWLEGR